MKRDEALNVINQSALAHASDQLPNALLPAVRIKTESTSLDKLPLGASRFGGLPDVPEDFVWPQKNDVPLAFLAQLNLQEVAPFDLEKQLPEGGWLYFFYDAEEQPWGFDPQDEGAWRVIFVDASQELTRVKSPERLPEYANYFAENACRLEYEEEVELPNYGYDYEPFLSLGIGEGEDISEDYENLVEKIHGSKPDEDALDAGPYHHLLGYPQLIQFEDIRHHCQLVANGISHGGDQDEESPQVQALLATASDWILLLQIDTDEDGPGWMWGDIGRVYFCIRKQDLQARIFDAVWIALHCG